MSGCPASGPKGTLESTDAAFRPATALERFLHQQQDSSENTAILHASRSLAWRTTDTNGGYTIRFALPGVDFGIEPSGTLKIIQPEGVSSPTITIDPPALSSDDAFDGRRRMAEFTDGVALIHGLSPGDGSVRWIHDDAEAYDEALRFAVQIRAGEVTELNVTRCS